MSLDLYMDQNVPYSITSGLLLRNINVITAFNDKCHLLSDSELLDRASELNRVLFSHDADLLKEANYRIKNSIKFNGVIYVHQMNISIGKCIDDLTLIALAGEMSEFENRILFLPLK